MIFSYSILQKSYLSSIIDERRTLRHTMTTNTNFQIRHFEDLPSLDIGWLSLKDHFISTVGPHAGKGRPFKNLLVIADAIIQPNTSFPKHPHQDMEILTWVIEGTLHHQDNIGAGQFVPLHHLQLMSARDGINHAEGNSGASPLRILQIWIRPESLGGVPEVRQTPLNSERLTLLAGPEDAPLIIRQDLTLYAANVSGKIAFDIETDKIGYAVFIGTCKLNEKNLSDGDGAILKSGNYEVGGNGQFILILQKE